MIFITNNVFLSDKNELYLSVWGINRLPDLKLEEMLEQLCKEYVGEVKMLNLKRKEDRFYIEENQENFDNHIISVDEVLSKLSRYKNDKRLKKYKHFFNRYFVNGKTIMFINEIRRD